MPTYLPLTVYCWTEYLTMPGAAIAPDICGGDMALISWLDELGAVHHGFARVVDLGPILFPGGER